MMNPSSVSISTWNVLADCYAHRSAEVGDKGPVAWRNRSQLIATCLRQSDSDVLCLQEVDHYNDFYKSCLVNCGYRPCFVQRPHRQDGCLIAFKTNKFELVDLLEVSCDDAINADSLYEAQKYMKHNVALIVQLRDLITQKEVIVCTCHVHWNPMLPEVKMSQIAYILQKLKEFQCDGGVPIVLTGDFNTLPSDPIYTAITTPTTTNTPNNITLLLEMLQNVRYGGALYGPKTRFLCDASLSKLCKWLRVLGVNCALDSWDNGVPASSTKHRNAAKWQWTSTTAATSTATSTGADSTSSTGDGASTTTNTGGTTGDSTAGDSSITTTNTTTITSAVVSGVDSTAELGTTTPTTTPTTPVKATSDTVDTPSTPTLTPKEAHRAQFPISGDPTYAARITSINTFFTRAENEKRVILTTSKSLRERASCPKSYYIQAQKLEQGLIDICITFNLQLTRDRFLTVCGKCGDDVEEVSRSIDSVTKECVVHDVRLVDKYMPTDRTVFACVNCAQPYWWNEKAGSLPALAMERAEQLFSMVSAGIDKRNSSGGGGGTSSSAVSSSSSSSNNGGVVATPVMYQEDSTTPNPPTTSTTTSTTDTTNNAAGYIDKVPLSPPFQPTPTTYTSTNTTNTSTNANTTSSTNTTFTKSLPPAGTCILKDFGRTAKNPTLKNMSIMGSSDSTGGGGSSSTSSGSASSSVGNRSNSKSAELELEWLRLSTLTITDSTSITNTNNNTHTDNTTDTNTDTTANTNATPTSTTSAITTTSTTSTTVPTSTPVPNILTSNTPSMSIAALSQMFENRERSMKLVRESSGASASSSSSGVGSASSGVGSNMGVSSTSATDGGSMSGVDGVSTSTSNTELNELCNAVNSTSANSGTSSANSGNSSANNSTSSEGIALQSVYQLHALNTHSSTSNNTTTNTTTTTANTTSGMVCEPELTNWNGAFKGTLDYIFVSEHVTLLGPPRVLPTVHTGGTSTSGTNSGDGGDGDVNTSNSGTVTSSTNTSANGAVSSVLSQVLTEPQPSALWPSDHFIVTATLQY